MPKWKPYTIDFPLDDPIARLNIHYFDPCQQLFDDYKKARVAKTRKGERTLEMDAREICYLSLWLACLYAVVEGFKQLKLKDDKVDALSARHLDSLRLLRNGTFHFQEEHFKQTQFFRDGRLKWAEQLHHALHDYFSEYRVDFMVKKVMSEDP